MARRVTEGLKSLVLGTIGALPISETGKRRLQRQALAAYRFLTQPGAASVRIPPLPDGKEMTPSRASGRLLHRTRRKRLSTVPELAPGQPEVSIVIPVFNELGFTLQCLEAIESRTHGCTYEVIVVDDHSSDGTREALAARPGIRYLRNPENRGFIHSCNRGAKEARGVYLVMLNNDTEVMTNWLIELLDTFWHDKESGLVGAKLLYPTGALQEAGGILWRDGSAWNYGRGDHPQRPEYNYLREVDYVSGACIMVPKASWDRLGGFDIHFTPAYGEDSDLALRTREAGLKVLYQPMAEVIHYEGVSSGTGTATGVKAHQVENSRKLYARWRGLLAGHRPNAQEPEKEKERAVAKRILIIDDLVPTPDKNAGSITALGIMRICQQLGFKVTFIPEANLAWEDGYSEALARSGIESITYPFCKSVKQHLRARGRSYDAILVFRAGIASQYLDWMRRLAPQARIIFHTSDLHYLRLRREAQLKSAPTLARSAERTRLAELRVIAEADCTIVHSIREKEILEQDEGVDTQIVLFPWLLETKPRRSGFEARRNLFFMGGYQHPANVDAVRYFATEVWPLASPRIPKARFLIVGSSAPPEVQMLASAQERVDYLGFVEDLDDLMERARLSVAPVLYGAGIKGKLAMSMAYGVPCVTTALGAEGMDLHHGEDVLIAEDAAGLADAVVRLYRDPELWERLSRGAQAHVESHYSTAKGIEIMGEVLRSRPKGSEPPTTWRSGTKTRLFLAFPWMFRRTRAYAYWNRNLLAGRSYADWIERRERPVFADRRAIAANISRFARRPAFRLVIPPSDADGPLLDQSIDSISRQSYAEWRLQVVVVGSRKDAEAGTAQLRADELEAAASAWADRDPRIVLSITDAESGTAPDQEAGTSQWHAVVRPGDRLADDALYLLVEAINDTPCAKVVYTDEDSIDQAGTRSRPRFKPDWNPDLFYSQDYVSQLLAVRADLMSQAGLDTDAAEPGREQHLLLRCLRHLEDGEIIHVPWALYHELAAEGRQAKTTPVCDPAEDRRAELLEATLLKLAPGARIESGLLPDSLRVRFPLPDPRPLVSLIIPTRDRVELVRACVESILKRTAYDNFEILLIDNQSSQPETHAWLARIGERPSVRVLRYDNPFNYSAINNFGVSAAGGEIIGLVNNDIEVISPDWLGEMVAHALRPDIGCVGAKLFYGDNSVQHAGILLGIRNGAAHGHRFAHRSAPGYCGRLRLVQNMSAVSGACLVVRRQLYVELGGLDEKNLAIDFNDVDFCLRALEAGYRNLWTPYAELYHHESASRGAPQTPEDRARHASEQGYLLSRWRTYLDRDPAYNPNLTRFREDFSLG